MTDHPPYAFRVEPHIVKKTWGGRKLPETFGREAPAGEPIGESWEVADLPEGESRVATGPCSGEPLSVLVERWGQNLVGSSDPAEGFPLLVKIIDAADDLSVQVHPSERDVDESFPEANSKDECWLVLDADPGGSILHGVRDGVGAEEFRDAVDDGRAAALLRRIEVHPGYVVRVPPRTIHAICEGVTLLEIQQPSDTTYRVYDYDRPGLDGEPRELHLDRAMRVANFGEQPPSSLEGEPLDVAGADVSRLVDVPAYRIETAEFDGEFEWQVDPESPQVVHLLDGSVVLSTGEGSESVEVPVAETAVVPAACGGVRAAAGEGGARLAVAGLGGRPLLG